MGCNGYGKKLQNGSVQIISKFQKSIVEKIVDILYFVKNTNQSDLGGKMKALKILKA